MNTKFIDTIRSAHWYTKLGTLQPGQGYYPINDLKYWSRGNATIDAVLETMEWLPTTPEQADPFYGLALTKKLADLNCDSSAKEAAKVVYKNILDATREGESIPRLSCGPHKYFQAARGGALYSGRMACFEIAVDQPGIWNVVFAWYCKGYWPCGILPDKTLVIY